MKTEVESSDQVKKEKKKLLIATGSLVLATLILTYSYWPERKYNTNLRYFSDDDGKTWFTDDTNHLPPFMHNGKEAVGAIIYSYSGGSKTFCGYLMKFSDETKKTIAQNVAAGANKKSPDTPSSIAYGTEISTTALIKAPFKNGPWVSANGPGANAVLDIKSPDGSVLDQVLP